MEVFKLILDILQLGCSAAIVVFLLAYFKLKRKNSVDKNDENTED